MLIILLVRLSLKRGLAPLEEIGQQVRTIDTDRLDRRIQLTWPAVEMVPVVDQLNGLLTRLQAAVVRERRFTSDVAHELRTPLAELRTLAEVAARDPDDREMVAGFFRDVHEISLEMQHLVTNLLELSRCDAGIQIANLDQVDLAEVLDKTWKRAEAAALKRRISLRGGLGAPYRVQSDQYMLEQIFQNLVNNAVSHSPEGSEIAIENGHRDQRIQVTLRNPAPDLRPADLPHLCDRFWQKEQARTGGKNAGLGLALVHGFAKILGIDINTTLHEGQLSFSLIFPAS